MTAEAAENIAPRHLIQRVRHELKRRTLTVEKVTALTPRMLRITLSGADLADFTSLGYDDHIKLFLPRPGEDPAFPALTSDGRVAPDPEHKPMMRDYTPRRFDMEKLELDIDFALHDAGPATEWAVHAKPGDKLGIGGPRGSFVVAMDFDWYLLIGDETAIPAIARRLEELPAGAKATVLIEVADSREEQALESPADVSFRWLHRGEAATGTTSLMEDAAREVTLPPGDGYVFIACETLVAKRLRAIMVDQRQHPKAWIKAAGYWKRGEADFHETHGE